MADVLGLVAGSGRLPFEVADAARARGVPVAIVAIEGNTDPDIAKLASEGLLWIAPAQLGRLIEFLQQSRAREVILAGAVTKREMLRDLSKLRPDARALALLAKLRERGDDALLRAVAAEIESEGMQVVESTRYLRERLTPPGVLCGGPLAPALAADLALGLRVTRALGALDIGQAAVVKGGAVLAVEALEGTDAALRRGAELGGPGATLVKASKPGQDLRFDVPALGAATLGLAAELGIAAIGLEAGRTLLLERPRALELAYSRGVTIVGLEPEAPAERP
jgi:UDP-2,3-diacylglucosamine hydrolase